ncbi:hypothetical protein RO09_00605 [Streptococcus sobrinus]|nr:hypothetical protein RO09_00605 [Streptococcus sobrinus]
MPLFPTATTRVVCLNFLLSWISDHSRLAYPTVANYDTKPDNQTLPIILSGCRKSLSCDTSYIFES